MKYHNIELNNIENGPGIRTVLWVSGCYHNCKNCHNPITHDPEDGVEFEEKDMKELLDSLEPEHVQGITISGGDGLCFYAVEVLEIIKEVNRRYGEKKNIWLYTGFTLDKLLEIILHIKNEEVWETYNEIIRNIDVLCDGPFVESLADIEYHWVGSLNQRVLDIQKTFADSKVTFVEPDQEKLCVTPSEPTNKLLAEYDSKF